MKILSLFSGIGGLELGLERSGLGQTIAQVELDTYASKVLKKHWPGVMKWKDVKIFNELLRKQTSSAVASPARIYPLPERVLASAENVLVCGGKCYKPFAWYDQSSRSWKTFQHSLTGDWIPYSDPWPTAGMMRNGIAYRLEELEHPTSGEGCLSWPTPSANMDMEERMIKTQWDGKNMHSMTLPQAVRSHPTPTSSMITMGDFEQARYSGNDPKRPEYRDTFRKYPSPQASSWRGTYHREMIQKLVEDGELDEEEARKMTAGNGGQLNPVWIEWLMGFPEGYTDLNALATRSYRSFRRDSEN